MLKYDFRSNLIYIFIIGLIFFLLWFFFNISDKLSGEKRDIKGKVIELNIGYGTRGLGYNQIITFVYNINNEWYEGKYKNSGDYKIQYIGNNVLLEVGENSLEKYKVKGFYNNYNKENTKEIKYLRSKPNKYVEIKLINNVVHINEYSKGILLNEMIGKYRVNQNEITITPIRNKKYLKKEQYETTFNNRFENIIFKIDTIKNKEMLINLKDTSFQYTKLTL